jgi:hypothetical protein
MGALLLAQKPTPATPTAPRRNKVLVPVRYSAWLAGDLGRTLEATLLGALHDLKEPTVTRMPRAFVVEAAEEPGPMLEAVHRAVQDLERAVQQRYPVFHHQLGPVWAGTLQAVFA